MKDILFNPRPTIEFVTAMIGCASYSGNMKYIKLMLDIIDYEEMEVNKTFIKKLDYFYEKCLTILKVCYIKFVAYIHEVTCF